MNWPTKGEQSPTKNWPTKGELSPTMNWPTKGEQSPTMNWPTKGEQSPTMNRPTKGELSPTTNRPTKGELFSIILSFSTTDIACARLPTRQGLKNPFTPKRSCTFSHIYGTYFKSVKITTGKLFR
jgi:hypothetical protein